MLIKSVLLYNVTFDIVLNVLVNIKFCLTSKEVFILYHLFPGSFNLENNNSIGSSFKAVKARILGASRLR